MEKFPVNSGNIPPPPPSHSTNVPVKHAPSPNLQINRAQNAPLERIIGLTSNSRNMIASDPSSDQVAYAAGAVIILYNYRKNKQVAFLYPPPSVTNVVATGTLQPTTSMISTIPAWSTTAHPSAAEWATPTILGNEMKYPMQDSDENNGKKRTSAGSRPKTISCLAFSTDGNYLAAGEVGHQPRIFVWNVKQETLVCVLKGHKFGIVSVAFSSDMRHLASVGFQHDGYLNVWNWRKGTKVASNRSNFQSAETQVLDGRSGLLGSLRNNNFVDAAYDPENPGTAYLLSETGLLCMFKEERILDKWVDLQVKIAFSIDVSNRYIICACDNGIVRLFEPGTLRYCGMLPRPHPLGIDLSSFVTVQQLESIRDTAVYPDTLAIKFDATSNKVTCIYSDRSLIIWDVKHLQRIAMYRSFISHSECVWGTERFPHPAAISEHTNRRQHITEYESLTNSTLPPYTFASHSADGTVRFWNIDSGLPTSDLTMSPGTFPSTEADVQISMRRNIFSKELIKMLYLDPEAAEFARNNKDIEIAELPDHGIRALKISSDGSLLATGDRKGNLRVHRISDWQEVTYLEAHDSEILTIDFSQPFLIASASRDRLIHVFDIQKDFKLLQTMDDHSSSITAVKFSSNGSKLVSCSADKSVIFRSANTQTLQQSPLYTSYHNHSGRATVFDMELDLHDKYIVMVTGERRLNLLSLETGKLFRTCKPETMEEDVNGMTLENSGGSLIDIDLDCISGTFAVTAGSDKCVRLFDLMNGVCVHKVAAHSELVTSVRFLDGPHGILRVVSTSSDGSIFVWRVDPEVTKKMHQRTQLRATAPPSPQTPKPIPRLRRTSAVPAFQSGNQNIKTERKSFSHVSKSEAKYDDIYKKLERTPPPKLQTDAPQSPVLAGRIKGRISSPAPRDVNAKGVLTSVSTPRLINAEANARNSQWRGNFMSRKVCLQNGKSQLCSR
ncbi:WD40-repeat-containing domain protein [Umbelopsis sp. PMI_123]|nr:WD40-repeat-containing domain protein [Umbelopsis sp. PMI_123]